MRPIPPGPGALGQVGGSVARTVDGLGLLPVGLDEIGETRPVGGLESERLLEPWASEVGGHHDHPGPVRPTRRRGWP